MCVKLVKMTTSETYRLTHPELMSERELCEILENSCIEIRDFENLSKAELLEIYNRVALPLPQRGETSHVDSKDHKRKENLEKIAEPRKSEEKVFSNENGKRNHQGVEAERAKPPNQEFKSLHKKMRLCDNSKHDTEPNDISKRSTGLTVEEANTSPAKKRQKITWP